MMNRISMLAVLASAVACAPMTQSQTDGGNGSGGGQAGTGGGDGGSVRDGGTTQVTGNAPSLSSVVARVSGRTGRDLRLELKAKDKDKNAASASIRVLSASGSPVAAFDTDGDGQADQPEGATALEQASWTTDTVTAVATFRGAMALASGATKVSVTVVDALGLASEPQELSIEAQPVKAMGETCDASAVSNRCAPSLGCRGTPAVCSEGQAPQISRMAFFRGEAGSVILLEGTEPEDDLASVRFEFQNAQGQRISIDSDGDGTPDLMSFEQDAMQRAVDGVFFVRLDSGADLDDQAPKLVAIPIDEAGHEGTAKIASPTTVPTRNQGQTCDPRGFDTCAAKLSCNPGVVGATNKCASASPLRTAQCGAAVVLEPVSSGDTMVIGVAEGGSLWDAPLGCSSADPVGRPEGIIKLRLKERAPSVRISTVGMATNFDTTLYVLEACPDDSTKALACNDDAPMSNGHSALALSDVPAGDYLIVVDAFTSVGGVFELHVALE